MRRLAAALCALVTTACARGAGSPSANALQYAYSIAPPPAGSWLLRVEATFHHAPSAHLGVAGAEAVREVVLVDGGRMRALERDGQGWSAPACQEQCTIRYAVDLEALAAGCHRVDCLRRVGDAILGPASTWILVPEPSGDAFIRIHLRGDGERIATGLRRARAPEDGFVLRGSELGEASYTAFGDLRRAHIDLKGARLDIALLGAPLEMGDAEALGWVRRAASCVTALFGRFPVDATVFIVPVQGADEVVFGRVLSLAGASVALLFGSKTVPASAPSDWVVVHELFHLGCPSFVGEGQWLEEGLATYYEPILRERAGWMRETDLWSHFTKEMSRGLRRAGEPASLEERDDIDSTYWGGALFAFLADVRTIETTHGKRSLDDAIRAVLAHEGDATHVARVADFVRTGDEATGTHVLADLYARLALGGEAIDLDALWRSLGIDVAGDGTVNLRDDAPLAAVRRAIASGRPY